MSIPGMFTAFIIVIPKIKRLYEILELPELKDGSDLIDFPSHDNKVICMDKVSYAYDREENAALTDISLEIDHGERIAIVGESGSGKSTLLKLLIAYDDNYMGNIRIFGKEIREWSPKSISKYISYCPQIPFLMSKTIFENFSLYYDGIDEEILSKYARIVELNEDIDQLDQGYFTIIRNGGKNLSGGQKQRLGIMLGLMKKSSIYLFDEVLSALDSDMTVRVLDNIVASTNETFIVVTHKLYDDLMEKFDRIIVMEKGRIVGVGCHRELMNNAVYRNLYEKSQREDLLRSD
jgi:ABC-type bacteriocin/lantibiotic exporter with double-glycine peptidase domain